MGEHAEPVIGRTRRRLAPRQYAGLAVIYAVVGLVLGAVTRSMPEGGGLPAAGAAICMIVAFVYGVTAVLKWAWKAASGR
jgi:hypothetical protein